MKPLELVLRFLEAINAQDVPAIVSLMTDDHRFVDSLGVGVQGAETLREGWQAYFRVVPDYQIELRESYGDGSVVVLLGVARGTYTTDGTLRAADAWETPAAWRAVVRGDRIAEWQVYADNEPLRRRVAAHSAQRVNPLPDRPSIGEL
ncbi:MAG: nuclear transport factor 2 family protein [Planctomycetota bacterium]